MFPYLKIYRDNYRPYNKKRLFGGGGSVILKTGALTEIHHKHQVLKVNKTRHERLRLFLCTLLLYLYDLLSLVFGLTCEPCVSVVASRVATYNMRVCCATIRLL